PGLRAVRHAGGRPLGQGRGAGVLHRVLGHLKVSHLGGDGRHRGPPAGAEDLVELQRQRGATTSMTGRTSTLPSDGVARAAAHLSASSRSARSISVEPPNCSLISAAGPSVSSVWPSRTWIVVAALGGCNGAQSMSTPAFAIASLAVFQASNISRNSP